MNHERPTPPGNPDATADAPATPREAAKALVRPYVARGDPIGWYAGHALGYRCAAYAAGIGVDMAAGGERRDLPGDQITVTALGGRPCHAAFPLAEIWEELELEADLRPGPRQRRLC
jgi:hypothetical protein